jgi:methylmalonyl-CoA mutase cobalamin-binding subunit
VVYLGPDLPAKDIAAAATQMRARAVALSAVYANGTALRGEVARLTRALPRDTAIVVGGDALGGSAGPLRNSRVRVLADMPAFRRVLRRLRSGAGKGTDADAALPDA